MSREGCVHNKLWDSDCKECRELVIKMKIEAVHEAYTATKFGGGTEQVPPAKFDGEVFVTLDDQSEEIKSLKSELQKSQVEVGRLSGENEKLKEFIIAHCLVEKGTVNFDLHGSAVERLRKAMEEIKNEPWLLEALKGESK